MIDGKKIVFDFPDTFSLLLSYLDVIIILNLKILSCRIYILMYPGWVIQNDIVLLI